MGCFYCPYKTRQVHQLRVEEKKEVGRGERLLGWECFQCSWTSLVTHTDHMIFLEQSLAPWKKSHTYTHRFHRVCTCAGESEEGQKGGGSWEWSQADAFNSVIVVSKLDSRTSSSLDEVKIIFRFTRAMCLKDEKWQASTKYDYPSGFTRAVS